MPGDAGTRRDTENAGLVGIGQAVVGCGTASGTPLQVVLLESSPLLGKQGLAESLAGRFERLPVTHWSFAEMWLAFG
mgnify:CR=1 FL=1